MAAARPKSNLPINHAEQLAKEAAEITRRIAAPGGDRIKIDGNRGFIAPDGTEGETLEVVIIDFMSSNLYYEGSFDRGNPQPPGCFAIGPEPLALIPSNNSPNKQADTCSDCLNNRFGSAGKGKACKNTRLLAMIPAAAFDDPKNDAPLWILSVPPTSLRAFDAYVQSLASKHKTVPIGMVTQISLDQSTTFAAPRFSAIRPLKPDEFNVVMPRREEAATRLTAEPDVSGYTAPSAKPSARGTGRR